MATDELKNRARAALRSIIDLYTAGEAEVVRVFFSRPRTNAEYLDMVLRQMGREAIVAHWLFTLVPMGEKLERGVGRWELYEKLQQMADEAKHYALLADVAEWLAGKKLPAEELRRYEVHGFWEAGVAEQYLNPPLLPEAAKWVEVSRRFRAEHDTDFLQGVVQLTEGGGGGAFIEASRVGADEFQRRFARAMGQIVADEMRHGPEHLDEFVEQKIQTEADLERAARVLTALMAQHLRVRNEIYGFCLSEERLAAVDRGEVGPPPRVEAAPIPVTS